MRGFKRGRDIAVLGANVFDVVVVLEMRKILQS